MSMHRIPLTDIERKGLERHGLGRDIGKPSQLADVFRQGVKWGQKQQLDVITDERDKLKAELESFKVAVAHVTDDGKTSCAFISSEGWAMVNREYLAELEMQREELAKQNVRLFNDLRYTRENPTFNGRIDTWQAVAGKYRQECEKLTEQRDALLAALESFGHKTGCRKNAFGDTCTCGMADIIASVKGGAA